MTEPYLYLPGDEDSYVATDGPGPQAGDQSLDVRVLVEPDSWGVGTALAAMWGTVPSSSQAPSEERAFSFHWQDAGRLRLAYHIDTGSSAANASVTPLPPGPVWVRTVRDPDDDYAIRFYYQANGGWTLINRNTQTPDNHLPLAAPDVPLVIGGETVYGAAFHGRVMRAQVRIGGELAADLDMAQWEHGATSYTDPYGNTFRLHGDAEAVVPEPTVETVTVSPAAVEVGTGETSQLAATATYSDDSTVPVTFDADWVSDDETVATVVNGLVTGRVPGEARITATYDGVDGTTEATVVLAEGMVVVDDLILAQPDYVIEQFNPYRISSTSDSTAKPWGHGSWIGVDWAEERLVPMRILADGHDALQRLTATFAPRGTRSVDVPLVWRHKGRTRMLWGRPRMVEPDDDQAGHDQIECDAAFLATDPRIHSAEATNEQISLPLYEGGLTLPFTVPFNVPGVRVGGEAELYNDGTAEAYPMLRIDGPVTTPTMFVRHESGSVQRLAIRLVLRAGQWLEIDTEQRSVMLDGFASRRTAVEGDWPVLHPGRSIARFLGASSYVEDAALRVSWRSVWW